MRKFLCFIGFHTWKWSVIELGWGNGIHPPNEAKCMYCGQTYGDPALFLIKPLDKCNTDKVV